MPSKLTIDGAVRLARQAGGRDVDVEIRFEKLSAEQASRLQGMLAELGADEVHVRVHDATEKAGDRVERELTRLECRPHRVERGSSRWVSSSEFDIGPITFCAFLRHQARRRAA